MPAARSSAARGTRCRPDISASRRGEARPTSAWISAACHGDHRRRGWTGRLRWTLACRTLPPLAARRHLLVFNQYYHPGVEATAHLLTELCEALADEYDITVVTGRLRDHEDEPD